VLLRSLTEHKLSWKIPYIFDGSGTLSATIMTVPSTVDDNDQQQKPLSTSSIVHIQFLAENALFSSMDFEFACRGYRVSLLKKKICSGKFFLSKFFNRIFCAYLLKVNTNQKLIKINPYNSSNNHQLINIISQSQHHHLSLKYLSMQ
jgi:hypothetical protein